MGMIMLNEFLKEHKKVEQQQATIAEQLARVEVNGHATAKSNGSSHGATQGASSANPKSERTD